MDWMQIMRETIAYLENHLTEEIRLEEAAKQVHLSPFYLQKGFSLLTGYTPVEYVRNRRLYLAALDLAAGNEKVIDIALKYGYETPESFAKAFARFHGAPPSRASQKRSIRPFLPLTIQLTVKGGDQMNYTLHEIPAFRVIGFEKEFRFENGYADIPMFWDAIQEKYGQVLRGGRLPETPAEKAIVKNRIGEYGICIDDVGVEGRFRYMIAGKYEGGEVPEGLKLFDIPACTWAQFACAGPLPGALQSVNTELFNQWLPNNKEYEIALPLNIEWYSSEGNPGDMDYQSAIWVPVKKK